MKIKTIPFSFFRTPTPVSVFMVAMFVLSALLMPVYVQAAPVISGGLVHSAMIKPDGSLWTWGSNQTGQLGDGTQTDHFTPKQVGTDTDWRDVATGTHTVALKDDGSLWAWGYNYYGQLGDGTRFNRYSPTQIGSDYDWQSVSARENFTVALKSDGSLWSWGENSRGQLGNGTTSMQTFPQQIGTDTDWQAVVAGSSHVLALKTDGSLWGWGYNENYQLGDGTYSNRLTPVQIGSDTDWESMAAGQDYSLAIKTDGTLWGWGSNNYGALALGDSTGFVPTPTQVGTENDWQSLTSGRSHVLAIKTDRTLWSWGLNDYGQMGDGTEDSRFVKNGTPVQIGSDSDWLMVIAGAYYSMALKNSGSLWVWGNNAYGQLGNGFPGSNMPMQIGSASDAWLSIDTGIDHSVAVKNDGSLWAWGDNQYRQLGVDETGIRQTPQQVGAETDWQHVTAGEDFSMGLKSDGTLWAWGYGFDGRLGDGDATSHARSNAVQIGTDTDWQSFSTTEEFTVAIKSDGSMWAWGDGRWGKLGDGTETDQSSPVQIGTDKNWESVSTGYSHTLAVKTNGTLWAWGINIRGKLGDGTNIQRITPVQIGADIDWQSVAAGGSHSLAVKTDGTLWAWGDNGYGQLGTGNLSYQYSPVQVGMDTDWQTISAGVNYSLALKTDGTLWAWGRGDDGQLGNGANDVRQKSPVQVGTDTDWQSIVAGDAFSLALKTDDSLWAWGLNSSGQLGNSEVWKLTPEQILALDEAGPSGQVLINNGASVTLSGRVTLNLSCTDDIACVWMQFSNDDLTWSTEQAYTDNPTWSLSPSEGQKTVYVRLSDGVGNQVEVFDSITFTDETPPVGSVIINDGATSTTDRNVTLSIQCTDDIVCAQMQFSFDGTTWSTEQSYASSVVLELAGDPGEKTVYVRLIDGNGNAADVSSTITFVDAVPPSGQVTINSGANSTNNRSVTLALSCTDNFQCAQMQFSNDGANWSTAESYADNKSWELGSAEGEVTVYARLIDGAGNVTEVSDVITLIDDTAPSGQLTIESGAGTTSTRNVTLTVDCTDDFFCSQMQFSNDGVNWSTVQTYAGSANWEINRSTGENTVYARLIDGAGNMTVVSYVITLVDVTPPDGQLVINGGVASTNSHSVTLSLSCTDDIACAQMQFSNDGSNWSTAQSYANSITWELVGSEGNKTVYARFIDSSGNTKEVSDAITLVDNTSPSGQVVINSGDLSTSSRSVSLTLSCTDDFSCAQMQFSNDGANWSSVQTYNSSAEWGLVGGEGEKTVYVRLIDSAGNTTEISDVITLVDATPPSGQVTIEGGAEISSTRNVTLTLSCSDDFGCANMQFSNDGETWSTSQTYANSASWELTGGEGVKTAYVRLIDGAGNMTVVSDTITLEDSTPPTGSLSINGGADSTSDRNVTLTLSCSDDTVCARMQFSNDGASWADAQDYANSANWKLDAIEGDVTVYARFIDGVGNVTEVSDMITLSDTTSPEGQVTINGDANTTTSHSVALTLSCTDDFACTQMQFSNDGLAWSTAQAYADNASWELIGDEGEKTVYVRLLDGAGNSTDISNTITLVDATPPDGQVLINNGAATTGSRGVTLSLECTDDFACVQMQFSNDDVNWSPVQAYADTTSWDLVGDEGEKTVYVRFIDGADNMVEIATNINLADMTPPTGEFTINSGADTTNTRNLTLALSCSDDFNCAQMQFSNNNVNWSPAQTYAESAEWNLIGNVGEKTVYMRLIDGAGNAAVFTQTITLIDETPPTGQLVINDGADTTGSRSVTLSLSCSDDFACVQMQFSNDGTNWSPVQAYAGSTTWVLAGDFGEKTVHARLLDSSGNRAEVTDVITFVDIIPPEGRLTINNGADSTEDVSVTLSVSCSDDSGCAQTLFSNDGVSWSAPQDYMSSVDWKISGSLGENTVYVRLIDGAGNSAEVSDKITLIDATPPSAQLTINNGAANATDRSVMLAIRCIDNFVCAQMQFSNNGVNWSEAQTFEETREWMLIGNVGEKTIYARLIDGVGNATEVTDVITLIDATPPTGHLSINNGDDTTTDQNVTLSLSCTDNFVCAQMQFSNDGISWSVAQDYAITADWTLTDGYDEKTVYARFIDSSGNETEVSDMITLAEVSNNRIGDNTVANDTSADETAENVPVAGFGVLGLLMMVPIWGMRRFRNGVGRYTAQRCNEKT